MPEIAIAQVQPEFFEGVLDFDPRMVPGVCFVEAFLVLYILDDVSWMSQGEGEFVTLHGEDAAQTVGRGLGGCREVGGVCHQP